MEGEGKTPFHLLSLSPQQILLQPSIFSLDLKVLFYHGPRSLLIHFFLFPRSINYNYAFQCNKSSTPSLSIWFWLKHRFLSFPWNYGVAHGHFLRASNYTNKWRTTSGVISRFDLNITSSSWRTWNSKGAHSSWSWTPSSPVLLYFSELLYPGDFVASRPRFWWWTWNYLWRLYEIENIFIFAWSLVPSIGHYCWLCGPIHWLPPNSKVDHLVRTIRRILDFM
jgi:hypothetical protein